PALSHEPPPHPIPLPIRWGEGGRRSGEGWFVVPMRGRKTVETFHEPSRLRVADPRSGPRLCEAQRFMVPMRGRKAVETLHEPRGTSNIQRRTSNGRRESSITSTFEVRCLYLGSVASTDEFS